MRSVQRYSLLAALVAVIVGGLITFALGDTQPITPNNVRLIGAAVGSAPQMQLFGVDTNISMTFVPKGTGSWTLQGGLTLNTPPSGGTLLTVTEGTLTTAANAVTITGTWNNGAAVFQGIFENIVNTASASGSFLIDLQTNGVNQFTVDLGGNVGAVGSISGNSFAVGSGTVILKLTVFTPSITPGSQAANSCAEQSFAVTGVATNDKVFLSNYPATGNATGYGAARVTAANTVGQVVCNPTAGALQPASGTFTYTAVRS